MGNILIVCLCIYISVAVFNYLAGAGVFTAIGGAFLWPLIVLFGLFPSTGASYIFIPVGIGAIVATVIIGILKQSEQKQLEAQLAKRERERDARQQEENERRIKEEEKRQAEKKGSIKPSIRLFLKAKMFV